MQDQAVQDQDNRPIALPTFIEKTQLYTVKTWEDKVQVHAAYFTKR